jgi:uncharacterized protein with HEPN domain
MAPVRRNARPGIHAYFGVDYEIVWDVAVNRAPELARIVQQMLEREDL